MDRELYDRVGSCERSQNNKMLHTNKIPLCDSVTQ